MRYLLDTNIVVFILLGDKDNLSLEVQDIVDDFANTLFISSFTLVELIFLFKNEKIKTKFKTANELLSALKNILYFDVIHSKPEHLQVYSNLKIAENHKDQIDHFIISQAICEGIPLVSSDRKFREYSIQNLDFVYNKRG